MFTIPQILPFLEHPERLIRNHAAGRIGEPNSDPATARDALRAYDRFPEGEINSLRYLIGVLPADADGAREMARRAAATDDEALRNNLERGLMNLPAATIQAIGAEFEADAALSESVREHIAFQRAQLGHSPEQLWETLQDMARKTDQAWEEKRRCEFSDITVKGVQKALARHSAFIAPIILEIL